MIERPFWHEKIQESWSKVPLVWLSGPRRIGKTSLVKSITSSEFLNCDLPSVQDRLENPELFYSQCSKKIIIFDEIHKLNDPSQILKIGTDNYPQFKLLATGSSTLEATKKFRDSLAGRKRNIVMLPVLNDELAAFNISDTDHRLLRGGFPQPLLAETYDNEFYAEWMESYFARDIQELFRVEKRNEFNKLLKLAFRQSGGQVEFSNFAKHSGLTRPTVVNYFDIFSMTHAVRFLPPFSEGGKRDIIGQPKMYAMDTGFVAWVRGWETVTPENRGDLWEHFVFETLSSSIPKEQIYYWRNKSKMEVDFVLSKDGETVHAIECKWNDKSFDPKALLSFRSIYPKGKNFLVANGKHLGFEKKWGDLRVMCLHPSQLASHLKTIG